MCLFARACLTAAVLTLAAAPLRAQVETDLSSSMRVLEPRPRSPHADALALYTRALLQQQRHCLVDAARTLEQAVALEPKSAALHRALFPLYLALERRDEALTACREALDLDPDDCELWLVYARQLRLQEKPREALDALEHGAASPRLKRRPELSLEIYRDLGSLQETFRQYDRAAASLTAAVAILEQPDELVEQGDFGPDEIKQHAADLYERLGRICVQAKQLDRAVLAYEKACTKDPGRRHRLAHNLADVCLAREELPQALAYLDAYLQTEPQDTGAYEQKSSLLRRLGREREVVPELEQYTARDPNNVALQLLLGRELARAGQNERAMRLFQDIVRQSPSPEVYRAWFGIDREQGEPGLARCLKRLDDTLASASGEARAGSNAESATHARAMLAVLREDPTLVRDLLPVVRRTADRLGYQSRLLFGLLALRARQLDLAERLYRSCMNTDPDGDARRDLPEVYAGLLRVLWLEHRYATVAEICRHGLAHAEAGNPVLFRTDLARALVLLGKNEEAVQEADEAVRTAGDRERFYARRARALVQAQAERYDLAVAECQGLLADSKEAAQVRDVRYTLSSIYSLAKDQAKSEEQLRLILDADANDATANNDLGYLWADQNKNLTEAERMIRKALVLDKEQKAAGEDRGENGAYLDSLGWAHFRQGRLDEARSELERASTLPDGADDPVVWDHLGDVCLKRNDPAGAAAAWQKAVELYEMGRSRRADERYRQVKEKRKLLQSP